MILSESSGGKRVPGSKTNSLSRTARLGFEERQNSGKVFSASDSSLDKPLPCPFGKLSRLDVRCRIEENDGASLWQRFDDGSSKNEFGFGQIVKGMQYDAAEPL